MRALGMLPTHSCYMPSCGSSGGSGSGSGSTICAQIMIRLASSAVPTSSTKQQRPQGCEILCGWIGARDEKAMPKASMA